MDTNKYYLGIIEEINGDREYSVHTSYTARDMKEAEALHLIMVSSFYGEPDVEEDSEEGVYHFNGVEVYEGDLWEVSKITYNEFKNQHKEINEESNKRND